MTLDENEHIKFLEDCIGPTGFSGTPLSQNIRWLINNYKELKLKDTFREDSDKQFRILAEKIDKLEQKIEHLVRLRSERNS